MLDAAISSTWKTTTKIPTTTHPSGQSTGGLSKPAERSNGDPYRPICEELHALLTRKRGYYGCREEHPLENARGVAEQGIQPWVYQIARIGEKLRRAGGLRDGARTIVNVEAMVRDTLMDIAGHAVVALALLDNPEESA